MYKLIAIDLDGTLLNSNKRISDENKEAIRSAIASGVHVVVCSGRIYAGARIFGQEIGTKLPLITCNGARIKDMETEEVIYSRPLQFKTCEKIIDVCQKNDVYYHIYVGDIMYTEKLAFSSLFYWNRNKELPKENRVEIQVVDNMKCQLKDKAEDISKVVVICDNPQKLSETREEISRIKDLEIMSSNFDNFEIMNGGVSKGHALKYMAEKYGISREEVMAIGDNENDMSMLEYAGLAIAMANGEDYVKEICDYVTLSNNENGVAFAINKFVLTKSN